MVKESEIINQISMWNQDNSVNGILIHMPIPYTLQMEPICKSISIIKDVEGFNPVNITSITFMRAST